MVKIDLITGFLGAGKTTFIREYAKYLMDCNENICILENDFGAVNVDMMLLQDLMGDQCDLEMIAGGCDLDCHKRRFKTKLISMAMLGFDRVIVEPSGIFEVEEFFDLLCEEPLDRWYKIENVIAIVDAKLDTNLSKEAHYLFTSQIATAGEVVLSRVSQANNEEIEAISSYINSDHILAKDWSTLSEEDFKEISTCGYHPENQEKLWFDQHDSFSSLYYMNVKMSEKELYDTVEKLLNDKSCGNIFRVKGFMKISDSQWVELNATHHKISISPIAVGQEIIIVIGEELVEEEVNKYWK